MSRKSFVKSGRGLECSALTLQELLVERAVLGLYQVELVVDFVFKALHLRAHLSDVVVQQSRQLHLLVLLLGLPLKAVLECDRLNGLLLNYFNCSVLSFVRSAPALLVLRPLLVGVVSLEAVDRGVGLTIFVLLHDLLVVRLVESVILYQLPHRRQISLLQHSRLRLLQGRVHVEVELSRLVLPVVHHFVYAVGHVTRIGARITSRQDRLNFL